MANENNLSRLPNESELAYISRLGSMKDSGIIDMTWAELANIMNRELRAPGEEYSESAYRKKYAIVRQFRDEHEDDICESVDAKELVELRRELEKERVKIRDERNEYKKLIRDEARKESYKEQFLRAIEETAGYHKLEYVPPSKLSDRLWSKTDLIIPLTDLHSGIEIKNMWNTYDVGVLKERMRHYLDRIFEIQDRHNAECAHVVLSEVLSGIIHPNLRVQNNQDLIEQFLTVTDYICDFLKELSGRFKCVFVYVAPGNHSRINAKKDQDIAHENMDNLLLPFIRATMQNYRNISCCDNEIEQGMAVFPVRGLNVVAVHGDKDNFNDVANSLSKLLRIRIDLILIGHRHTNGLLTDGDIKVVQSGCMSGSDEFAINHRLRNRPEQAVCVITEDEGLDCIYDIKF